MKSSIIILFKSISKVNIRKNLIAGIILSAVIAGSSLQSSAQKFEVGDNVLGAGIGLGSTLGFSYGSSTPALSAQYEHGMWSVGGPGTISLGGFLAYKSYSYDGAYYHYTYSETWSYTIIGIRSAYHYNGLNAPKFDPYAGLMLSYDIASFNYTSSDPKYDYLYKGSFASATRFSLFLGGRYYFSNQWAAYAEIGFGNSILTLGAAYKF
ncbi:MAG: hypothetical protein NT126_01455 [Bacteroidetes bacterium]|nr:hypothetical protein [Bacteroidota bacterium]